MSITYHVEEPISRAYHRAILLGWESGGVEGVACEELELFTGSNEVVHRRLLRLGGDVAMNEPVCSRLAAWMRLHGLPCAIQYQYQRPGNCSVTRTESTVNVMMAPSTSSPVPVKPRTRGVPMVSGPVLFNAVSRKSGEVSNTEGPRPSHQGPGALLFAAAGIAEVDWSIAAKENARRAADIMTVLETG